MINGGNLIRRLAGLIGSELRDDETGEILGKAIVIAYRGRILVIGYTGDKGLRPVPVIKPGIRYWVQEMRFRAAEEPDYPRLRDDNES